MLPNGFVCVCIDRLALIRQQREEAAKKREEEKAGKTKHYLFLKIQSLFLTVSDLILMSHFCCSERREESRCSQMSQVFKHIEELPYFITKTKQDSATKMCCFFSFVHFQLVNRYSLCLFTPCGS